MIWNPVTKDVESVVEELKDTEISGYKDLNNKYYELLKDIEKHNDLVSEILDVVEYWDYEETIKNITRIEKDKILSFKQIVKKLDGFTTVDSKTTESKKEIDIVADNYDEIIMEYYGHKVYEDLLNFEDKDYISVEDRKNILANIKEIFKSFDRKEDYFYPFKDHLNIVDLVNKHNSIYLEKNKRKKIFDNINEKSLDDEQRTAVLMDERSLLVVAGAGSGKTLTICGKVKYLIEEQNVNPDDILLLSYSKKSADDLEQKVRKISDKLSVGTFHKIGLDILKDTQKKNLMVEEQYAAIIESYFREELKNRPVMRNKILIYYGLYINPSKSAKKFDSEGELFEELKKANYKTLKDQLVTLSNNIDSKETIKKELVKSFEELAIANWYFINGIDYIYEAPYEFDESTHDKRQYMPDFKLKKYNVYHEHYGLDSSGKASQYDEPEASKYEESVEWKKNIHFINKTDCIETFSYEFEDGTVFAKLENELKKRNIELHPISNEEISNALNSIYESLQFKSFINLIRSFLSLYKSIYSDELGFDVLKKTAFKNGYEHCRTYLFLDIVKDIFKFYKDYLEEENKIDFDDMILQSLEELNNTENYKYKYIIVDEFQDISMSRLKFLKGLIEKGNSKLFAVGDDWQAIYRFSGCDLNIFLNFSKYFDNSAVTKITTTHRNSQELQDIAGPFIRKNPEQIGKKISSPIKLEHPVQIMYYTEKKYFAFLDVLKKINEINPNAHILVLGRNNKDFDDISLDNRIYVDYKENTETLTAVKAKQYPNMRISYSTVHGSKGLEEDYVILINADDSKVGFPNKMEDDELLNLVLSDKSEYQYAEERRLWYVALTRTRTYTYIIANANNPSLFLKEIEDKCVVMNPDSTIKTEEEILCPRCKTGRLVLRTQESTGIKFYGCSNYPYCNYSIEDMIAVKRNKKCPICGDYLIFKRGKFGAFYGCHSYPRCDYTEKYEKQ